GAPAARHHHEQPHARGARRPEAPLPVSLDRLSHRRARAGDFAPPQSGARGRARPRGRGVRAAVALGRPHQGSRHRRDDRLGRRADGAGRAAARAGADRADPGCAPQVPGGRQRAAWRRRGPVAGRGARGDAMTTGNASPGHAFLGNLILFGRVLRRAGLSVDADQTRRFAQVLAVLGFDRRGDVKAAGRVIFVRRREERALYDAAFDLFWRRGTVVGGASEALPRLRQVQPPRSDVRFGPDAPEGVEVVEAVDETTIRVLASREERLRTADFADLTPEETRAAAAMLAALRPALPLRPSRRRRLARGGGRLAAPIMLRPCLGTGGALVLLVSDGWERDDPAHLARELATLRRTCHRLIWLDPLAGRPRFEPVTQGLLAALPHVDEFVPCGNVASLEELAWRLAGWSDRRIA